MKKGFTLVEIMVAMATFTILLIILSQIFLGSLATVSVMTIQREDSSEARQFFDRLEFEIGRMLKFQDVDYSALKQQNSTLSSIYGSLPIQPNKQVGNDKLVFFTETQGTFNTTLLGNQKSSVSLVSYQIDTDLDAAPSGSIDTNPSLRRCSYGLYLDQNLGQAMPHLPTFVNDVWPGLFPNTSYMTASSSIFRMEYRYFIKSYIDPSTNTQTAGYCSIVPFNTHLNHTNANGMTDVAAIIVTVALLDQNSRNKIPAGYRFSQLINAFPDAQDSPPGSASNDVAASWVAVANSGSLPGLPQAVVGNIRIYERYFYLN